MFFMLNIQNSLERHVLLIFMLLSTLSYCISLCVGLHTALTVPVVYRIPATTLDFHLQTVVLGGPRFHQLPRGMVPLGVFHYLSL